MLDPELLCPPTALLFRYCKIRRQGAYDRMVTIPIWSVVAIKQRQPFQPSKSDSQQHACRWE